MPTLFDYLDLNSVDSTSAYLKRYLSKNPLKKPLVCHAKIQTAGYGQQAKRWQSNHDSLTFSVAIPIQTNTPLTGLLSLQTATILHQTLVHALPSLSTDGATKLMLKWPNDLYLYNGKVAGLLIETLTKKETKASQKVIIIGIGINIGTIPKHEKAACLPYLNHIDVMNAFLQQRLNNPLNTTDDTALRQYWQQFDYFTHQETLTLSCGSKRQTVHYAGISSSGQALVFDQQKNLLTLHSGQESLLKA